MSKTSSFSAPFGSATASLKPSGDGNGGGASVRPSALVGGQQSMKSKSSSKPWYTPEDIDRATAKASQSWVRKTPR